MKTQMATPIAGLQTSNILIPNPEIRKAFQDALDSFGYDQLNTMGLVACEAAYSYGREWLDTVKEYIRLNVDFTRDYLKENLPKMKLIEPEGTYSSGSTLPPTAFPTKTSSTKSSMTATLARHGIHLRTGRKRLPPLQSRLPRETLIQRPHPFERRL